ncbi:D-serine ammonia-lyase [Desulforhopalus singaporensis]|uniref:Probable D-serine dehydratase n=1 Tax=Desulforhopalus singaporensis TaxID=91360 RepID=A0A1H0IYA1_9BACT|nr:D-serine ammonia-lyase [Desulforhopalus singaporensis]SDO36189.1 D-serine ammonia-lyase [Desulforhopalus singaporensis]
MREKTEKSVDQWCRTHPLVKDLVNYRELTWHNPEASAETTSLPDSAPSLEDMVEAEKRWHRFRPFLAKAFPETAAAGGIIESGVRRIATMQQAMTDHFAMELPGTALLKCDHQLPVSGSIKARGGIYEVLKLAEEIALAKGFLSLEDDYAKLCEPEAKAVLNRYSIAVGSTGNLGLSIGIIGAALGFRVTVHMSHDARAWKKNLLRQKKVTVVEHKGSYSAAVAAGRKNCANAPRCHFIDDENSKDLFLGYSVAALRLKNQLAEQEIAVDHNNPLFVYLPCGVGGGPGGITFGLKHVFGHNVYCYFAEPTHAPCMFLGLYTKLHERVAVTDFGLDNVTDADGLAVGRPSGFVGKIMGRLVDGLFTVNDTTMYRMLALLADTENIRMEPSALAGMVGIVRMAQSHPLLSTNSPQHREEIAARATHLVWGTGGSMVPEGEMSGYYERGKQLLEIDQQ